MDREREERGIEEEGSMRWWEAEYVAGRVRLGDRGIGREEWRLAMRALRRFDGARVAVALDTLQFGVGLARVDREGYRRVVLGEGGGFSDMIERLGIVVGKKDG